MENLYNLLKVMLSNADLRRKKGFYVNESRFHEIFKDHACFSERKDSMLKIRIKVVENESSRNGIDYMTTILFSRPFTGFAFFL